MLGLVLPMGGTPRLDPKECYKQDPEVNDELVLVCQREEYAKAFKRCICEKTVDNTNCIVDSGLAEVHTKCISQCVYLLGSELETDRFKYYLPCFMGCLNSVTEDTKMKARKCEDAIRDGWLQCADAFCPRIISKISYE